MRSTVGRPRALTDAKVARILAWDDAWREARLRLKTLKELALELGVSEKTIRRAIACGGRYKGPSPERHKSEVAQRRRLLNRLARQKAP
jgi:predicted transcriptional regulator